MRRTMVRLVAFSLLVLAIGAGTSFAQICPPSIGGSAMTPTSTTDGAAAQAASSDLITHLFSFRRFASWGSVSLIQPGIRSSAFALRERRGLTRLIP